MLSTEGSSRFAVPSRRERQRERLKSDLNETLSLSPCRYFALHRGPHQQETSQKRLSRQEGHTHTHEPDLTQGSECVISRVKPSTMSQTTRKVLSFASKKRGIHLSLNSRARATSRLLRTARSQRGGGVGTAVIQHVFESAREGGRRFFFFVVGCTARETTSFVPRAHARSKIDTRGKGDLCKPTTSSSFLGKRDRKGFSSPRQPSR